ncbi:MAG: hypothetical protein RR436_03175 [Clostridia bacterium]
MQSLENEYIENETTDETTDLQSEARQEATADTIPQDTEAFLDIKYNHTPMVLSKEHARELAQKGLNYDKLALKLENELANNVNATTETTHSGELDYFFEKHLDVDPRQLPYEVLDEYQNGTPLDVAYEKYLLKEQILSAQQEIATLKEEFMKEAENEKNANSSSGSISGISPMQSEFYTESELEHLTGDEIAKNLDKALSSMTFISQQKKNSYFS